MYSKTDIQKIVARALEEDAAKKDITSKWLLGNGQTSTANIIVNEDAVLCGMDLAKMVFKKIDKNVQFHALKKDGQRVKKGAKIALIKGKSVALLAGERTALNFISYLSGISTLTQKYVKKIKPYKTKIFDTRKTTPGLRMLEKHAVRCGGGFNHRYNLNDMVLIKDNHLSLMKNGKSLKKTISKIRKKTKKPIEIEADQLNQLENFLPLKPDFILLDNMKPVQMKKAVQICSRNKTRKGKPVLEASGGIHLNNVRSIAKTGVERISIGALTHSHRSINVSMELEK